MPNVEFSKMPTPKGMELSKNHGPEISKSFLVELLDAKFAKQDALIRELLAASRSTTSKVETKTRFQTRGPDVPADLAGREVVQVCDLDLPMPIETEESVQDDAPVQTPSKITTRSVKLGLQVMKERWEPDPPWKSFVKGPLDGYMGIVVIINLAFMILETQSIGAMTDASLGLSANAEMFISETFFEIAEYIFFTMYALDVLVRVVILRHEWYYDPRQGFMFLNVFDACVVAVNAFELLVLPLFLGICQ